VTPIMHHAMPRASPTQFGNHRIEACIAEAVLADPVRRWDPSLLHPAKSVLNYATISVGGVATARCVVVTCTG
jgi:hypothetical protein